MAGMGSRSSARTRTGHVVSRGGPRHADEAVESSAAALVDVVFRQRLGRAPQADELAYWIPIAETLDHRSFTNDVYALTWAVMQEYPGL